MLITSQIIQNNAKLQNWSNYNEFASMWCQNDQNIWVTSQNIQNNAKLQNWSNYNELHRFDVKTIKTFELGRKTFKTTQNYKSNQIPLNLHRFEVKTIKILRYVAKLQKWSNYNELRWFDVKTFKTFQLGRKTTKVIKLQWSASIWHQNNQKCRVTS